MSTAARSLVLFLFLSFAPAGSKDLIPAPASMSVRQGRWEPGAGFQVAVLGFSDPRLERAIGRFLDRLKTETQVALSSQIATVAGPNQLAVICSSAGRFYPTLDSDESYSLSVGTNSARLAAPEALGILRGLETFLQLVDPIPGGFSVPSVEINDHPRFRWRGLLIDVCRHWIPPDVVLRQLDAMAALKLNVLHWHLSEDQGFRVESIRFPRLHQFGSDGHYYSQQDIRSIVEYAADRGIRVVPEFDMPGHTTAWFVGHPELASLPGPYEIERRWGIFDPCMDPTREEVYAFVDAFIGEMVDLFPDPVFHMGGDEVNGVQWNANPAIQAFKQQHNIGSNHELQAYFTRRVAKILGKYGKTLAGWDEVLSPGLPEQSIIHSWRGPATLIEAVRSGYRGLSSSQYYLDFMLPASFHYRADPLGQPPAELTSEEESRILGGEVFIFGEFVTPANIEGRIWPRAIAVAERLWSPPETLDLHSMYRRLEGAGQRLERWGITYQARSDAMLLDLANGATEQLQPLKRLACVLKPAEYYYRPKARTYTSLTPLDRMVDAVLPERSESREFASLVDQFLADRNNEPSLRKLRDQLQTWADNHDTVKPVLESNARLNEVLSVSAKLAQAARIGLQAISYAANRQTAPGEWIATQKMWLDNAQAPEAETVLLMVPAIKRLVSFAGATSTMNFPQFGDGAAIRSSLLLLNTDAANGVAGLAKVFTDRGLTRDVIIDHTTEPGFFPFDLSPLGVGFFETSGRGEMWTGAVQLEATPSLSGTLLLSGDFGVAGLRAERAAKSFRIPVEYDSQGSVRTGLAIANPGPDSVTVDLALRNASGTILKSTSLSIPARGQLARFPEELFGNAVIDFDAFEGGVEIRGLEPVQAVAIRTSPGAFATLPAVPLEGPHQNMSFPQLAYGAGLWSMLVLVNPSDVRSANVTVKVFDNAGRAINVPFEGSSSGNAFSLTVPAAGIRFMRTTGTGPILAGSMEVWSDSPIGGSVIYSGTDGVVGVGPAERLRRSVMPVRVDSRCGIQTAVAVANPGEKSAKVTLTLRITGGNSYSNGVLLPPHGQIAMFLHELFRQLAVASGPWLGSLEISSPSELSSVAIMTFPGEMAALSVSP